MSSEKVAKILLAKSNFTAEEIAKMTDKEGWAWIYSQTPNKKRTEKLLQVCFSGFSDPEKKILVDKAIASNFEVHGSVTKDLFMLCIGDNPGPSKIKKALAQNVHLVNKDMFYHFIETGEMIAITDSTLAVN